MQLSLFITALSLVLQTISVFLTFRLIVLRGKPAAGVVILTAIVLMDFRRAVSMFRLIDGNEIHVDIFAETIACTISLLLLIGVTFIGRLISSLRTLGGLLPICYACKRIRDDRGYWKQVELYIEEHSRVEFTHGLCPECGEKRREEIMDFKNKRGQAAGGRRASNFQPASSDISLIESTL